VISSDRRLSSALDSYAMEVFAFLPKPLDPAHVFATVERAMERRRDAIERRRLTWDLALLHALAALGASSRAGDAALQRAIARRRLAFDCQWGFVRLTPIGGGRPVVTVASGVDPQSVDTVYRTAPLRLPSDDVFATGKPVRVDAANRDRYASKVTGPAEWKATISVPITSGEQVLGVVTLVSANRDTFSDDDERIIVTIGRQFGVAVANAQLYQRVHRAKVEWELTFDAISDPIGCSTPSDARCASTPPSRRGVAGASPRHRDICAARPRSATPTDPAVWWGGPSRTVASMRARWSRLTIGSLPSPHCPCPARPRWCCSRKKSPKSACRRNACAISAPN
jgi:hypothetical protein